MAREKQLRTREGLPGPAMTSHVFHIPNVSPALFTGWVRHERRDQDAAGSLRGGPLHPPCSWLMQGATPRTYLCAVPF